MPCRFCHPARRWQTRRVCSMLGRRPRRNSTHRDGMSPLRWYESLLSALTASFLFREQPRPSRPPAFFLPGTCKEKAAGQRVLAPRNEWAYTGCNSAYLTLSSQRVFTHSLHPPRPASLCGLGGSNNGEMYDSLSLAASDAEELSGSYHDPAPLHPAQHSASSLRMDFSASCLTLWRSWVWNGLPQRNCPIAAWMNGSCQGTARPLGNELCHSSQRSTMRSPNLGVYHTTRIFFVCLHFGRRRGRKRIRQPASPGWVSGHASLPTHGHWLEGKSNPPIQTV